MICGNNRDSDRYEYWLTHLRRSWYLEVLFNLLNRCVRRKAKTDGVVRPIFCSKNLEDRDLAAYEIQAM